MEFLKNIGNTMAGFSVGWVDFLTIIVVLVGITRGRKRGLSEEILDTTMWLAIVVASGFLYKHVSDVISIKPVLSKLTYNILSYLGIALAVKLLFVLVKRKFGQKIVESDSFGRIEFYAGMGAGAVRFLCVYLFLLNLLHAPYYSPEFLAQRARDVDYNYGSDFFPHPCKMQVSVFKESLTGRSLEKHLGMILMEPTEGNSKAIRDENSLAKRNEKKIDAIMGR